ncbi:MAG: hypothetical protein FJ276_23245 [Planctomycetes bacterium]|nr:hypothetical protein [Planctomycetota bacterium]
MPARHRHAEPRQVRPVRVRRRPGGDHRRRTDRPIQVRSIVPFGQSRRPESPHYADQTRLYSAGQMRPAWHGWSQLRDHVGSKAVWEYSRNRPHARTGE